jgi:hypothetical protein
MRRAFYRLAAHKAITIVGAPVLAELIVRKLANEKEVLEKFTRWVVPIRFHEKVVPIVTSRGFHRALWITILVATLGNYCLKFVNFLLDLSLPNSEPTDPRLNSYER